ncbi:MAG: hypothetical protein MR421_02885 [Prevotella sp.]|nr:hypothetical protein [Prevotella sp.]
MKSVESLTLSPVPHSEALAFAHPVKNEQRTETHAVIYYKTNPINHTNGHLSLPCYVTGLKLPDFRVS